MTIIETNKVFGTWEAWIGNHGFYTRGYATRAEAVADVADQIARTTVGEFTPIVISWNTHIGIVWREPPMRYCTGYYRTDERPMQLHTVDAGLDTAAKAERSIRNLIAQHTWDGTSFAHPLVTHPDDRISFNGWAIWQRLYAHYYAITPIYQTAAAAADHHTFHGLPLPWETGSPE